MGIEADITADWQASLAALAWQVDLGVTDIISESPMDRYDLPEPVKLPDPIAAPKATPPRAAPDAPSPEIALNAAQMAADGAQNLDDLREAMARFDHCDLKRGARNLVFADGNSTARVLILTESPDTDEDRLGRPCQGPSGQMLDKMFAAIGLSRDASGPAQSLYIIPVLPWRAPNREPTPEELAMLRPFVARHIALVNPAVVVLMGNSALQMGLNATGIQRARGTWGQAFDLPTLPMMHPSQLLRLPAAKREAWADLLSIKSRL